MARPDRHDESRPVTGANEMTGHDTMVHSRPNPSEMIPGVAHARTWAGGTSRTDCRRAWSRDHGWATPSELPVSVVLMLALMVAESKPVPVSADGEQRGRQRRRGRSGHSG
jgi:hypothetical protein